VKVIGNATGIKLQRGYVSGTLSIILIAIPSLDDRKLRRQVIREIRGEKTFLDQFALCHTGDSSRLLCKTGAPFPEKKELVGSLNIVKHIACLGRSAMQGQLFHE
jgi:hypothetical protein